MDIDREEARGGRETRDEGEIEGQEDERQETRGRPREKRDEGEIERDEGEIERDSDKGKRGSRGRSRGSSDGDEVKRGGRRGQGRRGGNWSRDEGWVEGATER